MILQGLIPEISTFVHVAMNEALNMPSLSAVRVPLPRFLPRCFTWLPYFPSTARAVFPSIVTPNQDETRVWAHFDWTSPVRRVCVVNSYPSRWKTDLVMTYTHSHWLIHQEKAWVRLSLWSVLEKHQSNAHIPPPPSAIKLLLHPAELYPSLHFSATHQSMFPPSGYTPIYVSEGGRFEQLIEIAICQGGCYLLP